jgi:hypothetical protein
MVGDVPKESVDAGAVEREALEAAAAAAAEAQKVDSAVRAAEAQVSGDPSTQAALPAPEPVPPSAALGSADYNGAGEPERA